MQHFDLIVIGGGSGLNIVDEAAKLGLKVALVEKGPMGGTCLNRGCIPSKILIHSADVVECVKNAPKFGIFPKGYSVDFKKIISRVSRIVDSEAQAIEEQIRKDPNVTLFKTEAHFVGNKKLKAGNKIITGDKIIIFAGTRPLVPPIEGLHDSGFLTSKEALRLKKLPKSLTIIGGGYIAAELAHFFGSLGTKINIIQRNDMLVPNEDHEVACVFTEAFRKRFNVILGYNAEKVQKKGETFVVTASSGKTKKSLKSEQLLLAVGRVPNSDVLKVDKTGLKVNHRGYIVTDDYMETTAKNVWAGGDIAGKYLFKHSANVEAQCIFDNAFGREKKKPDYEPMPHSIFSSPQIAGVGAREQDLKKGTYAVGKYSYISTGMGTAMQENTGFAKFFVEKESRRILGCHIIGPQASTLIHEVVVAMRCGRGTIDNILKPVHVHPALSEVVQRAARNVSF